MQEIVDSIDKTLKLLQSYNDSLSESSRIKEAAQTRKQNWQGRSILADSPGNNNQKILIDKIA
jgi:hypothetical protein